MGEVGGWTRRVMPVTFPLPPTAYPLSFMDLLALRTAAGGGTLDGFPAAQLAAAGFTLLQRSAPLVRALAGKRAALLLPTSPQFLVGLAAADGRGAVLINPLAAPAEIAYQLEDAGVGAVLTVGALAPRLPTGTVHALLDDAPMSATVMTAHGAATRVDLGSHFGMALEADTGVPGRDEECAVVYTSAMRGRPLGAILTHRNLLANALQAVEAAANTRDDHVLAVLPFSHLFGLTTSGIAPLLCGARISTMARFDPLAAVERIEREGITEVVGVPAMFGAMLGALERRGGRLRGDSLRLCICGGAPLPVVLQERWRAATGVDLRQGYGLTEASPVALFNRVQSPNRPGTLGVPFPGVRVSIRHPESGAALPAGTEGEICVAGPTVFHGYVRGGELGLAVRDGWLYTGDIGVEGPDGTVTFRGVRKPMFTRNGFNIYPRELEQAIGGMPGVVRVEVSGIPEPAREHDIGVRVSGAVSEDAVRAWCRERLAAYKQPSRIEIVPPAAGT
jgi:long-chain acyl-CoA synthetase